MVRSNGHVAGVDGLGMVTKKGQSSWSYLFSSYWLFIATQQRKKLLMVVVSFSVASHFFHVSVIFAHVAMIPSCLHLFCLLYAFYKLVIDYKILPSCQLIRLCITATACLFRHGAFVSLWLRGWSDRDIALAGLEC
jgi:hypothetical protein